MHKVVKYFNAEPIDWRGSSADPTDTNGLPMRNTETNKAEYMPFDTFPLEGDELPEGKDGWIILMEEINSAPRAVIAACYKLILDRLVGNKKLHPKVKIICLGNLITDGAIVNPIGTAMGSRLVHLVMGHCIKETRSYMAKANFDPRIIAYAHFAEGEMYKFDPKTKEFTFACIRTWSFVNQLIGEFNGMSAVQDLKAIRPAICGAVSEGVGTQFVAYCDVFHKLPVLKDLVNNPHNAPIPAGMDVLFALATAIANNIDEDNLTNWVIYVNRLPLEHKLLIIQMLFARNTELALDQRTDVLLTQVQEWL